MTSGERRRVVNGFRLPSRSPLTENEWRWIETLRAIAGDSDPAISYDDTQMMQVLLTGK